MENKATPLSILKWLMGVSVAQSLYVAAELGVAEALADGPRSCDELSRGSAVDAAGLYLVLRMLASIGLFTELPGRCFSVTTMGRFLHRDQPGSVRDLALFVGSSWHLQPWTELLESVRTGNSAFEHWHGMRFYQYLGQNPDAALIFDRAMSSVSGGAASAVVAACDLEGAKTLVDVGGGQGALLALLLKQYPSLSGVLLDMPSVIDGAEKALAAQGLTDRCTTVAGDFLTAVPEGGDVYLLSRVLHNWHDEQAIQILSNCRSAMDAAGKILVAETLMGPTPDFWGSWLDLEMLMNFGSRERSVDQYDQLFDRSGLRRSRTIKADATVSIFELVAR